MIDLKIFRESMDLLEKALRDRGSVMDLAPLKSLEEQRRKLIVETEALKGERNRTSDLVAEAKRSNKPQQEVDAIIANTRAIGDKIKEIDARLGQIEEELLAAVAEIPNLPHESVPAGKDENDNQEIRKWGEPTSFEFDPRPHWEIGEELGILDFQRATKVSGSRFTLLKGMGARLERALINYMMDLHAREHGHTELFPPILVSEASMYATGQLPKFREELYSCNDGLMLNPTAEVPVTNIHRDEILSHEELPLKYVAYTPCFRREAGAAGKETRGIIRQHQFNKVELVRFARPENSYDELEDLTRNAEAVLKGLGLPYRVIALCTGDLGFSAAKTYDIEVWMPSYQNYKEISSCSNFQDFQARRASIRFKDENGKVKLVHTLNGSGLAVGRTMAAILENYQRQDGRVSVPPALVDYMHGLTVIG